MTKHGKSKKFRQNKNVKQHFHPRFLARAVIHNTLAAEGASGVNKVAPGTTQSMFATHWRDEAESFARR